MSSVDGPPQFENIDWESHQRTRRYATAERITLVAGLAAMGVLSGGEAVESLPTLFGVHRLELVDWVFLLAAVVVLAYGVVPLGRIASERLTPAAFASYPAATVAGGFVLALTVVGLVGPLVTGYAPLRFQHAFHPPVGFTSSVPPSECLGVETGEPFERRCHSAWEYPLGTNERGHPMGFLLIEGARVATYVIVIALAFIVPAATAVGVVAGIRGGVVDDVLSSYVDVQLCLPAILVYFIGYAYWGPSLLLLLATFGVLSWGGIARLVRSEVIQRREDGHVLVARSLGASESYVARTHILPNSTNTLVPATFQLLALFVLIEAGVAFLGFHQLETYSWGSTISESINAEVAGQLQNRADHPAYQIWWVSALPAAALTATLIAFKMLGDGMRDALDPRSER
ncbi:MAG: ABC transporter permease [Halorubrum sp.]